MAKNESLQNEMAASKETLAMYVPLLRKFEFLRLMANSLTCYRKDEELRQAILKRQRWEKEMQKQGKLPRIKICIL